MKTLEKYKAEGYEGPDASLETSLFEYGLAWKALKGTEYSFLYGVSMTNGEYSDFDIATMDKETFEAMYNERWFLKDRFNDFRGSTDIQWPGIIHEAILYHGYENIFGSSYHLFSIDKGE